MKTNGSSLIELLIVIVILGLIFSFIVPTYAENALQAKYNLCFCARQKILSEYLLLITSGELEYNQQTLESFLESKKLDKTLPSCPFDGNYQVEINPQGILYLTCSYCGNKQPYAK